MPAAGFTIAFLWIVVAALMVIVGWGIRPDD